VDLAAGRIQVDGRVVELRPKTWEVLCALVQRRGQLVSKHELLDLVWKDTAVSEGTLNKSIGELRTALGDNRDTPHCIETVSRRGFRWIGEVRVLGGAAAESGRPSEPARAAEPAPRSGTETGAPLIARSAELELLHSLFDRARGGERQVAFLIGEAGAGKTTLVDHFLRGLADPGSPDSPLVAHAQCLETAGVHEPYLPLLDALERLVQDPHSGAAVAGVLQRFAPAWVAQMPALAAATTADRAAAPGSMLREFVSSVDEIARDRPLVLVLEDAHWADLATTDACSALARRRDPARLLVLVTKRSAEAMLSEHPIVDVRRDLVARQDAEEISLAPFVGDEVHAYLRSRCPGLGDDGETIDWLLQQTAGNPLFVRLVLDEWIARGLVSPDEDGRWRPQGSREEMRRTVPDSLRALLERQLARLEAEERALLDAVSVRVGAFHPLSICAAAGLDAADAESLCEGLAGRGQLLREAGTAVGADGRLAVQYAFLHAMIQNVVVAGLQSAKRRRLHRGAAEQLEKEYAGRTQLVAAQLASHYEAAGDIGLAVANLLSAAKLAMHRDAARDAIGMLEAMLALIDANPGLPSLEGDRLVAMRYLSHARQLAYGFVDPTVRELWSATRKLAMDSEDFPERLLADAGRIVVGCVSGRYAESEEIVRAALPIVERVSSAGVLKTFLFAAGTLRYRMAMMADSSAMFDAALAMVHEGDPIPGNDMDALLLSQYAPAVALVGRPDEVRRMAARSLARAEVHSSYSECVTAALVSWALALLHDHEASKPIAARTLELASREDFRTWSTRPLVVLGLSSMAEGRPDEGLAQIREGLDGRRRDGQRCDHSAMSCLIAEALLDAGLGGAEDYLREAEDFVAETGELYAESEVFRLRARVGRLGGEAREKVEALLRRALDLAQLRGIGWHALRAASDLASLLVEAGRGAEVPSFLGPALGVIEGGDHLRPVRDARRRLAECQGQPA
jgi:DNA-binding winged helix-turn-helix (wHTH) protein